MAAYPGQAALAGACVNRQEVAVSAPPGRARADLHVTMLLSTFPKAAYFVSAVGIMQTIAASQIGVAARQARALRILFSPHLSVLSHGAAEPAATLHPAVQALSVTAVSLVGSGSPVPTSEARDRPSEISALTAPISLAASPNRGRAGPGPGQPLGWCCQGEPLAPCCRQLPS